MIWEKNNFKHINISEKTQKPVIISASRATDIPAFFSQQFINKLKTGFLEKINPFNGKTEIIEFKNTRVIVFWSKNPQPLIQHLNYLHQNNINYYIQYTLNNYSKENLEPFVPSLDQRITTFKKISDIVGPERIIWRFDPILITQNLPINELLNRFQKIGNQIHSYTSKIVFGFLDDKYSKVQNKLSSQQINWHTWNSESKQDFATKMVGINKQWNLEIASCAEELDLSELAIKKNKCIDPELMIKLFHTDSELMNYLGYEKTLFSEKKILYSKKLKDKGQRKNCGCIVSKDIGKYNTCIHGCLYCYANHSHTLALKNYQKHQSHQS